MKEYVRRKLTQENNNKEADQRNTKGRKVCQKNRNKETTSLMISEFLLKLSCRPNDAAVLTANVINAFKEITDQRAENRKINSPPFWDENVSIEAWARYIRIWNQINAKPHRNARMLIEML